jgi:hypothetical protein
MKVRQIKVLQFFTVVVFVSVITAGFAIVFFAPDRIGAYKEFVSAIWPLFVAEVVPAFLGVPLKEAVKNIRGKECGEK